VPDRSRTRASSSASIAPRRRRQGFSPAQTSSVAEIRRQLRASADPRRAEASRWFFKTGPGEYGEGDRFLGLSAPMLQRFAREHQHLALHDIARLLQSRWHEERALALLILVRQDARAAPPRRAAIHRFYLRHLARVDNWDLVDCSAPALVGAHVRGNGALLRRLAHSPRVWDRRVAIIATLGPIRRGDFRATFQIARLLLDDPHDLIHKAVGWMLREVGKRDRGAEERFLDRYVHRMPRTMLRYAIERLPPRRRAAYLAVPRRPVRARAR
jgi:3-methyladenine DNA glycosylase AlkD